MTDKITYRLFPSDSVKMLSPDLLVNNEKDKTIDYTKKSFLKEIESNLFSDNLEFDFLAYEEFTQECTDLLKGFNQAFTNNNDDNMSCYHSVVFGKIQNRLLGSLCFENCNNLTCEELLAQANVELDCTNNSLVCLRNFHIPRELFRSQYLRKMMEFSFEELKKKKVSHLVINTVLVDAVNFKSVCDNLSRKCQFVSHYKNENASCISQKDGCVILITL